MENKESREVDGEKVRKHAIDPEVKAKILDIVKSGSVRVKDAAETYEVDKRTIYGWLSQEASPEQTSSTEVIKLRRENKALLELLRKADKRG